MYNKNKNDVDIVGAAWKKTTKKGDTYLSISLGDDTYFAFKNNNKNKDSSPDFFLKKAEPLRKTNYKQPNNFTQKKQYSNDDEPAF